MFMLCFSSDTIKLPKSHKQPSNYLSNKQVENWYEPWKVMEIYKGFQTINKRRLTCNHVYHSIIQSNQNQGNSVGDIWLTESHLGRMDLSRNTPDPSWFAFPLDFTGWWIQRYLTPWRSSCRVCCLDRFGRCLCSEWGLPWIFWSIGCICNQRCRFQCQRCQRKKIILNIAVETAEFRLDCIFEWEK